MATDSSSQFSRSSKQYYQRIVCHKIFPKQSHQPTTMCPDLSTQFRFKQTHWNNLAREKTQQLYPGSRFVLRVRSVLRRKASRNICPLCSNRSSSSSPIFELR